MTEKREKDVWERRKWYFTWSLPAGVTIVESSWVVDSPDVTINPGGQYYASFSGNTVYVWVMDGAPLGIYQIDNRILLSDGQRLEDGFTLVVMA